MKSVSKKKLEATKKAMRRLRDWVRKKDVVATVFFVPGIGSFQFAKRQITDWDQFWCAFEQIRAESLGYA